MSAPVSGYLEGHGARLHYLRWGDPSAGRPAAVLTHGLGFVGATWALLARELSSTHVVYALDRRGHGRSAESVHRGYAFSTFADDLTRFIEALRVRDAYGIGHSAGATDLLLTAGARPEAFARIFVVEPTVQDPAREPETDPTLSAYSREILDRTRQRRARHASFEAAFEHAFTRSPLRNWHPEILREQVLHGCRVSRDGGVELVCSPSTEADMLVPIFQAMEGRYPGREHELLTRIACPVLIASTDRSHPVYPSMADVACRVVSHAWRLRCSDATHFWPQEEPDQLAAEVAAFARDTQGA